MTRTTSDLIAELKCQDWLDAHPEARTDGAKVYAHRRDGHVIYVKRTDRGEEQITREEYAARAWLATQS